MYVREAIEVTKNISEIALELDMLDTDNDESIVSQIDEAKTALNS
jgi:hypothetical protein